MKYKYYKTKYQRLDPADVFVYLGDTEYYCAIGQHGNLSIDYLKNNCKEISLDQYVKTTKGLYTPEEYLKVKTKTNDHK